MPHHLLKVENLSFAVNGLTILNNINLFLNANEIRFLIGPNGAGKTTLMDIICGKISPSEGRIVFKEKDITYHPNYIRAKVGIVRKFQTPSVFNTLTVRDNLILSFISEVGLKTVEKNIKEINERIEEISRIFNLEKKLSEKAQNLSHGERQMLELCMIMVKKPSLVLLDEPGAGLSKTEKKNLSKIIEQIRQNTTVLIVEHDMDFVRMFETARVTVLHEGQIIAEGKMDEIQNNKQVIEVYLGKGRGRDYAVNQ